MSEGEHKQQRLQMHLSRVLREMQEASEGRLSRQELIRRIEEHDKNLKRRMLIYVGNMDHPASALTTADIVPLGDALASLGQVDNLDVMLHTPGGSGEVAEKFVEMCRRHCRYQLRVIVPNMAKSAGTLIALGADEIIMGYCSELGPIDPQIRIMVSNQLQWVSAWTFIRARDLLQQQVHQAIASGQNPAVYLQQLAGIDPVFVTHCEQLMIFARQLVYNFIFNRYRDEQQSKEWANKVVDYFGNVEQHITHGRLILAREIRQYLGQNNIPLIIRELDENDELWQLLWELYVRGEVFLRQGQPKAKLIETAEVSLKIT